MHVPGDEVLDDAHPREAGEPHAPSLEAPNIVGNRVVAHHRQARGDRADAAPVVVCVAGDRVASDLGPVVRVAGDEHATADPARLQPGVVDDDVVHDQRGARADAHPRAEGGCVGAHDVVPHLG